MATKAECSADRYVVDILIFWHNTDRRDKLKAALSNAFKMKHMDVAKNCVGLNITYDSKDGIMLD